jgi:hypothetical protein
MLLIRTDESGTGLELPRQISRKSIPIPGDTFYCTIHQKVYRHIVNHSYSPDDKSPLFSGIVHAIYSVKEE